MLTDPNIVSQILINTIRTLYNETWLLGIGPEVELAYSCEAVFGVMPSEIVGVHTYKKGAGDGIWFRLKDDRVLDKTGAEDDSDPGLYDTKVN